MHNRKKSLSILGMFLMGAAVISFIVFYLIVMISNQGYTYIDPDTLKLVQTEEIPQGAPTAVITTTKGEIRCVLYPEYAPQTVAQFERLAEAGYYNDTYVFEAKNDVYFAAGAKNALGDLPDGATEAQERIPRELHQDLWPFRGALCSMTTATDTSFTKRLFKTEEKYTGSRFMLLGTVDFSDEQFLQEFREASASSVLADTFLSWGGVPNFSQQVAVFGQTYAGLDVIDAICAAPLQAEHTGGYTPPQEDIKILTVTISSYGEEDAAMNELKPVEHFEFPTEAGTSAQP
ncbi:MAG: peptidylprolyl isomerase [Oscillospiraceae bacterium]|nr:peptidylprolyl isomerase [Oscillospiraceae bacterium]